MTDQFDTTKVPVAFISYKWESESHLEWVRTLASDLRKRGIDAKLDQWEVRPGDSFTDYMQRNVSAADVILFVITDQAVHAAEAPEGQGGALKFEVQMMNARRMAEGTRIIGLYRSGERPPQYLRETTVTSTSVTSRCTLTDCKPLWIRYMEEEARPQ